jgi:uncharacterized protein YlxW (UPF0749 family)
VSPARRGGGVRALGASLLDRVLEETLDPSYAQAAEARAARGRDGADARPRRPRLRAAVAVAVTMALAGLLVALAYNRAAAGSQGREQIRTALIADIQAESAVGDELSARLTELDAEVSRTRDHLLAATTEGQRALDGLARARTGAGATVVTGPGLRVTLANAKPDADADPVGGRAEDPRGRVRDGDLQLVVNALWAAGAEAVSVNDQRLGPTSAIRFAGEAVLVDFRPVTNPYEIRAIGDPERLAERFLANPDVGALAVISETFGLRFEFAQEDELSLPAANSPDLRFAVPLSSVAAAAPPVEPAEPVEPVEPADSAEDGAP